jgi:hypothetical protein
MGSTLLSDRVGGGVKVFEMVLRVHEKPWAWDWVVWAGEVIHAKGARFQVIG